MSKDLTSVLEITDRYVKFLQVNRQGFIAHCRIQEITQPSDPEIAKVLSSMVTSARLKTINLVALIPRQFVILRHIHLPSHVNEEIEKMATLQIPKQIPYPKEDVVMKYAILKKESSGYTKILAMVVHKEVIERYLKIVKGAKLTLNKLALSSAGLLHWYLYEESKLEKKSVGPIALIHLDSQHSEICFLNGNKLLFARNIQFGAKDLTEEHTPKFLNEIALTFETYTKEAIDEAMTRIVLVGSVREIRLLKERLESQHKIRR